MVQRMQADFAKALDILQGANGEGMVAMQNDHHQVVERLRAENAMLVEKLRGTPACGGVAGAGASPEKTMTKKKKARTRAS